MTSQRRHFSFLVWSVFSVAVFAAAMCLQQADFQIVLRTLALGAGAAAIAVPCGAMLAWTASKSGFVPAAVRAFCLVGVLLPVLVYVSAWDAAFGKLGWMSSASGQVLKPVIGKWQAAIWIHAMIATPQIAILFWAAIRSGRQRWQDAIQLDRPPLPAAILTGWWKFSPFVIAAILWTVVSCAREIGVTDIYQIGTLAEQVYLGYSLGQLGSIGTVWTPEQIQAAQDLGIGVSLLIIAWLAGTATMVFLQAASVNAPVQGGHDSKSEPSNKLQSIASVILMLILVAVPLVNLIVKVGFTVIVVDDQPTATWTVGAALQSLSTVVTNFQNEFRWSALIALASTVLITAVALPVAWLARNKKWMWWILVIGFSALVATPGPTIGLGIAKVFTSLDFGWAHYLYDRTILAPVIANAIFCLPLALLMHFFLACQTGTQEHELAVVDGITGWRAFWHLNVRPRIHSHLICLMLVFAISFGELSASQMVLPPGIDSVPRLTLGLLHSGVSETVAAITLVGLAPFLLVALLSWLLAWLGSGSKTNVL